MPSQNVPVQRLKLAVLPLDLPCSGLLIHSGEIIVAGNCDKKKAEGLLRKDDQKTRDTIKETSRRVRPDWINKGPTAWQLDDDDDDDDDDDNLHGR